MEKQLFGKRFANILQRHLDKDTQKGHFYANPGHTKIDITLQEEGLSEESFWDLLNNVVDETPHTANKTFFNQLFGGRLLPALAGDMLSSVLNNSMYTYKVSGIHTLIEKEVIKKMCDKVGFYDGDGIFNSGGSVSNFVAIMHAAQAKVPIFKVKGRQANQYTMYTSEDSHYSLKKGAGLIGIGYDNVRTIPVDKHRKMNIEALEKQILQDIASGLIPLMINATAGTTVWGAFDPLLEIATVAHKYNIWVHVDASRGGGVCMHPSHKQLMNGIEHADSVTWNPHKMLNVPLTLSAFLVRDKLQIIKTMGTQADYLFQTEEDRFNHGTKYLQCGRRHNGFKFWCARKYLGEEGYKKRIAKQFALTAYATEKARSMKEVKLLMEPPFLNICFKILDRDNKKICNALDRKGIAKIGYGTDQKGSFIRMVCVDPDMEKEDIDYFFKVLLEEANNV